MIIRAAGIGAAALVALVVLVGTVGGGGKPASAAGVSLTSITPSAGAHGAVVSATINGSGFAQSGDCDSWFIQVLVGMSSAFPLSPPTRTQVTVAIPALPPGVYDVEVRNPCDGTSDVLEDAYTVVGAGFV